MNIDVMTYDELKAHEATCVESIDILRRSLERQTERLRLIRARVEVVKQQQPRPKGPQPKQLFQETK